MPLDLSLSLFFPSYKTYTGVFICAFLTVWLLTPLVIRLALHWNVVDHPNHRKVHARTTPLLGGLAIFVGLWIPIVLVLGLNNLVTASLISQQHTIYIMLLAGLAMLLLGLLDDVRNLNATWKFSIQIPVAMALVAAGVRFENVTLPGLGSVSLGEWGALLTVLWLVGMTNALNLVDGIDGLATGVAFFACGTNAIISALNGNQLLAVTMCAMAGACLAFLRYNFSPARIFLGDTGSQFIGMTLAVISTLSSSKGPLAASLLLPMVILGYPLLDTMLAIARRKLRGKPVFSSDKEHIHHRLLALGLNHRWTSLILYGVCLLFSALAVAIVIQNRILTFGTVIVLAGIFLWGLYKLGYLKLMASQELNRERLLFQAAHQYAALTKTRLQLSMNQTTLLDLLRRASNEFGAVGLTIKHKPTPAAVVNQWTYQRNDQNELILITHSKSTAQLPSVDMEELYHFGNGELEVHLFFSLRNISNDLFVEYKGLLAELFELSLARFRALPVPPELIEPKTESLAAQLSPLPAKDSHPTPYLDVKLRSLQ